MHIPDRLTTILSVLIGASALSLLLGPAGISSAGYVLYGLFKTNNTMTQIFWSASSATKTYSFGFTSVRTPSYKALMDPYAPSRYYRSVIGSLGMTAATWRG